MKLLDIMKKYDRCLVRESAKLTKIYNMILKESEAYSDDLDEETCPDCGEDPCVCDKNEELDDIAECGVIPEKDFFDEACKGDECDECDKIPDEDFIREASEDIEENDMLRNRPHNAHINDPRGIVSEDDEDSSNGEDDMISAKEFFAEAEKDAEIEDINEDVPLMSAEEFFAEAEKDAEIEDINEEVEFEPDCEMADVRELLAEKDEDEDEDDNDEDAKNLEESLKSYRRKNHHLFNG